MSENLIPPLLGDSHSPVQGKADSDSGSLELPSAGGRLHQARQPTYEFIGDNLGISKLSAAAISSGAIKRSEPYHTTIPPAFFSDGQAWEALNISGKSGQTFLTARHELVAEMYPDLKHDHTGIQREGVLMPMDYLASLRRRTAGVGSPCRVWVQSSEGYPTPYNPTLHKGERLTVFVERTQVTAIEFLDSPTC